MTVATAIPLPVKAPSGPRIDQIEVTAIGSCRIANPLRRASTDSVFRFNQSGVYGYTHSSAEALQQIEVMQGRANLPNYIRPFIAPNQQRDTPHTPSDMYMVELSSAKVLSVDGICVQLNYFNAHFRTLFDNVAFSREYWKLARDGSASAMRQFLDGVPAVAELSRTEQDVLSNLRLGISNEASLEREISEIREALPDVLFVTHFNALTHAGPIRARRNYIELVKRVLNTLGAPAFDPSDYVEAFGQANAVEDGNVSLTHYSDEFQDYLLELWTNRYIGPRAAEKRKSLLNDTSQTLMAAS